MADHRMHVGHDLDENLYPWVKMAIEGVCANSDFEPSDFVAAPTNFNFWQEAGISDEDFWNAYKKAVFDGLLAEGDPNPGELEFLQYCIMQGHRNHIITARTSSTDFNFACALRQQTHSWINKHFGTWVDSLIISRDKSATPTNVFFDDHWDNLVPLLNTGYTVPVVINRSWNDYYHNDLILRARSVTDKYGIVDQVQSMLMNPAEYVKAATRSQRDEESESVTAESRRRLQDEEELSNSDMLKKLGVR